jgi:predicted phage tail protein
MAASAQMSVPQRRIRGNTKALDALKAGAVIMLFLLGCILVLWLVTQLLRPKENEPDMTPQHGKSMWETPPGQ